MKNIRIPSMVGAVMTLALFQAVPSGSADFWADGNLTVFHEETDSGRQRFVVNAGLAEGANREMVFGSAVARTFGAPTALWNDERRVHVATEVIELMAQVPAAREGEGDQDPEILLMGLGLGAEGAKRGAGFINAFEMNYWRSTTEAAGFHNWAAKNLRRVNPRTIKTAGGRVYSTTNFDHVSNYFATLEGVVDVARGALLVSDVAVGACLRAAIKADEALYRLDMIESALGSSPDPAVRQALLNARINLTLSEDFWGSLFVEMNNRQAEFDRFGAEMAFKYAMHAVGAKGTLGVVLVFETIVSDWDQHDTAQIAVMAATLEEKIRAASEREADREVACELAKAAAMARFMYFDRMVDVTSLWQGRWVDLLSRGRPYADARGYFEAERSSYGVALAQLRAVQCFQFAPVGAPRPVGCGVIDLALLIDSSGSMGDNDPRELRKEAASLLLDRAPGGTVFSVIDFDDSATTLVSRSTNADEARRAISSIDAAGGTNIEGALNSGYSSLRSGTGARAAILFTDGRSDQRGGIDGYLQDNIPIHVVGLGSGVDTDYLQRVAGATNGLYMHATSAGDLTEVFDRLISELACEGTVFSSEGTIRPGEVIEHTFLVDATISRLTVRVTWPGSRIDVELIGPTGAVAGQEVASGPTYRIVAADVAEPGRWTARVIGTQVSSSGEPYSLRAGGPSDLRLAVSQPDRQDPSVLTVSTVDNTQGIRVSKTWSRVRYPNGRTSPGPSLVGQGTGTWSLPVPIDTTGIYTITAGLEGILSQGGDWSREITRTVVIGQGMVPWRGSVTRVEGGYVTINRGSRHGVREGMRVTFRPGSSPAGTGLVVSVSSSSSTVEVQEMWGSGMVNPGMTIELDRREWMADRR